MKIIFPLELTPGHQFAWPEKSLKHIAIKRQKMKPGKKLCIIEDYEKATRHIGQNNLFWKRAEILSNETGMSTDDLLRYCMQRVFDKTANPKFGKYIKIGDRLEFSRKTSTRLTISEYSTLMKEQDEIANILNEDRDEENKIILPTTENKI